MRPGRLIARSVIGAVFVGHGTQKLWLVRPRRQADHVERALAAALEIEQAVASTLAAELSTGIGLSSGAVIAGNVGGAGRLEFSVIGDAVNVAARVDSATRATGDTVLVSGHTRARLPDAGIAMLEARPELPLKGRRSSSHCSRPGSRQGSRAAISQLADPLCRATRSLTRRTMSCMMRERSKSLGV
ncbi:MAG: adenylate/guanylate cyclase domain-containing protein [Solirubrobacteraceae bacterium]